MDKEEVNDSFCEPQRHIAELINGPWSSVGYRTIWHILEKDKALGYPKLSYCTRLIETYFITQNDAPVSYVASC